MPTDLSGKEGRDRAYMAAAIRFARWNRGRTGTNPSVATLIVDDEGAIVGRGITAVGGRPHAEAQALTEAGERARGATAYVTLEPCAHHGKTPPCAEALIRAGIRRVVAAATDPDPRVSGRGYTMLGEAGLEVAHGVLAREASEVMSDYLTRSLRNRPEVTLKLAISADGMIGRLGEGQIPITGALARAQTHLLRAESHAIMVGAGTVRADDPELTCRLPGLEQRSPVRIIVGRPDVLAPGRRLWETLDKAPVWLAPSEEESDPEHLERLRRRGISLLAVDTLDGEVALPELLEDLSQRGIVSVLVEGGANLARTLLEEHLVDRILLFSGQARIGPEGIASPLAFEGRPKGFRLLRERRFGPDLFREWVREDGCLPVS